MKPAPLIPAGPRRPEEGSVDRPVILAIDDDRMIQHAMASMLSPCYLVRIAPDGMRGLKAATTKPKPDLILLDILMPDMDGFNVIKQLRNNPVTRSIPVIFITSRNTGEDEEHGLECGAVDFIAKPIQPGVLLARVRTQIELKEARDKLASQNQRLERIVAERTLSLHHALAESEEARLALNKTYLGSLQAIIRMIDKHSPGLGEHARRVAGLARKVALGLGLDMNQAQEIFIGGLLHDIGKVALKDDILRNSPRNLDPRQRQDYQEHPGTGAAILEGIDRLEAVAGIISHHHERYDGSGFPNGLAGAQIPLGARIVQAANEVDHLLNEPMPQQDRITAEKLRKMILSGRGKRYDPDVAAILASLIE